MYQTVYLIWARKLDRHDVYGCQASKVNLNDQGLINVSCYTEYQAYGLSLIYNNFKKTVKSLRKIHFNLLTLIRSTKKGVWHRLQAGTKEDEMLNHQNQLSC